MSGTYTNSDSEAERLNAAAAHDTGLYDPSRHDNHIVALYGTNAQAHAARDTLAAAGFAGSAVQMVDRGTDSPVEGAGDSHAEQGFWGAIKSLFIPDEDLSAYNHALQQGHAMLVVTPDASMDRSRLIHVLEGTEPVDFDAKLEEWRQSGYDYSGRSSTDGSVGAAAGMASGTSAVGADYAGTSAPLMGAAALNAAAGVADSRSTTAATSPPETGSTRATPVGTAMGTNNQSMASTGTESPDTIKVVEERLRVGKREVAQGGVRVRSYVVERPVEEEIRLHQENIQVERHPVDRPAMPGDAAAFQERVIEARATSEEAVVSKTARVVEEIGLSKQATERTETVRDTVRRTEVDVEDLTGPTTERTSGDSLGTGGRMPNATPDAGTSGANSPRK